MVIVLIATRYQKILSWLQNACIEDIVSIHIMKQDKAKLYLYVETSLDIKEVLKRFRQVIYDACLDIYIYQLYEIYNGKIDFHDYMSQEAKNKMSYYQTTQKDITEEDIYEYQRIHHLR